MDDVKCGRVCQAESVDDMFKSILGEEPFNEMQSFETKKWHVEVSFGKIGNFFYCWWTIWWTILNESPNLTSLTN